MSQATRRSSPRRKHFVENDLSEDATFPKKKTVHSKKKKPMNERKRTPHDDDEEITDPEEVEQGKKRSRSSKKPSLDFLDSSSDEDDGEEDQVPGMVKEKNKKSHSPISRKKKYTSDYEVEPDTTDDDKEDVVPVKQNITKKARSPTKQIKSTTPSKKSKTAVKGPRAVDSAKRKIKNAKKNTKMSISIARMHKEKANRRAADYATKIQEMAVEGKLKGLSSKAVSVNDLEEKDLAAAAFELRESHRANFERLNFPGESINDDNERSKHHSAERVKLYIRILKVWEESKVSKDLLTEKERKIGYTVVRRYMVKDEYEPDGSFKGTVLLRRDKLPPKNHNQAEVEPVWYRVVPKNELFDAIHEAHLAVGHAKVGITTNALKPRLIYAVTKKDVHNYIESCPVCISGRFRLPQQKGAKKPIVSSFFRDRFQSDLVDFTNNVGIGANGVEYRWLLTLKDHFTRLSYWRPLRGKTAEEVAEELSMILGFMGYPLVFHTDNGGELRADVVLEMIRELHPDCWTVAGQPRNPREQGSIERSHIPCKDVLFHMVQMYKTRHPKSTYTWVQFIGVGMGCVNSSRSFGRNNVPPYSHVFVQDFRFPTSVSTSDLRKATNPLQLSRVLGDENVTQRFAQMGEMENEQAQEEEEQSEDGFDPNRMLQEVTDQFRDLLDRGVVDQMVKADSAIIPNKNENSPNNVDDLMSGTPTKEAENENSESVAMRIPSHDDDENEHNTVISSNDYEQPLSPIAQPKKNHSLLSSVMDTFFLNSPPRMKTLTDFFSPKKAPVEEVPKKVAGLKQEPVDDDSFLLTNTVKLRKGYCEVNPSTAFHKAKVDPQIDKLCVAVHLDCIMCHKHGATHNVPYFMYFEMSYYAKMMHSKDWFQSSLLTAFVALLTHKHHRIDSMFDLCPFPMGIPLITRTLPGNVERLFIIAWRYSHYAFLEINVRNRYVLVKDGFVTPKNTTKWRKHIEFMCRKWCLDVNGYMECVFRKEVVQDSDFSPPLEPNTSPGVFEIIPLRTVVQRDMTECGPIAAYHAWEVLDPDSKPSGGVETFREAVIQELLSMFSQFDKCLRVRMKITDAKKKEDIIRQNNDGGLHGVSHHVLEDTDDEDDDEDACYLCNTNVNVLHDFPSLFQSLPCKHYFHQSCIHQYQIKCLSANRGGIVPCKKCGLEIANLPKYVIPEEGAEDHDDEDGDEDEHGEEGVVVASKQDECKEQENQEGEDVQSADEEEDLDELTSQVLNKTDEPAPWTGVDEARQQRVPIKSSLSPIREGYLRVRGVPPSPVAMTVPAKNTRLKSLSNSTLTRSKAHTSSIPAAVLLQESALAARVLERAKLNQMAKERQQEQADKMKQRHVENQRIVVKGNYVVIRVDKRDKRIQNPRCILGVVLGTSIGEGIKVVTEKGILGIKGEVAYCPFDTYKVLSDFATVPLGLRSLRDKVLTDHLGDMPLVSKRDVHLADYGYWFNNSCECKKKCGPTCKCVKGNVTCNSGCGCRKHKFDCDNCASLPC